MPPRDHAGHYNVNDTYLCQRLRYLINAKLRAAGNAIVPQVAARLLGAMLAAG